VGFKEVSVKAALVPDGGYEYLKKFLEGGHGEVGTALKVHSQLL
jgi:hypothetical protein